jgi:hypothetical protein
MSPRYEGKPSAEFSRPAASHQRHHDLGDPVSLRESLLPEEVLRLPAGLAWVDGLLDDPVFRR